MLALILAVFLMDSFIPSAAKQALPTSATEVQEYYSGSWNGDYVRLLRAKVPETDCPLYAKNLGLIVRFDPAAHAQIASTINMGFGDAPSWWTPPVADRTTYFEHKHKDAFRVLKYSAGYAYFVSTSW